MKTVHLGALILAPLGLLAACSSSASRAGSGGTSGIDGLGGAAVSDSGGTTGVGATGGATTTATGGVGGASSAGGITGAGGDGAPFSFFVASLAAMQKLSGNPNGFGGDLRYGESTGLAGADKICTTIAEMSMPGAGAKVWRAFLSTVDGPVNAKDRIGQGPWYDRRGRLIASTLEQLLMTRPGDADPAIKNDLPNEDGVNNQNPDGTGNVDNHDILTGTGATGLLYMNSMAYTCNDWTSSDATMANMGPWVGHSWGMGGGGLGMGGLGMGGAGMGGAGMVGVGGMGSGQNWMSALREGGCGAGINLVQTGGPQRGVYTVGTGGGYGAIYCFALTP